MGRRRQPRTRTALPAPDRFPFARRPLGGHEHVIEEGARRAVLSTMAAHPTVVAKHVAFEAWYHVEAAQQLLAACALHLEEAEEREVAPLGEYESRSPRRSQHEQHPRRWHHPRGVALTRIAVAIDAGRLVVAKKEGTPVGLELAFVGGRAPPLEFVA